MKETSSTAGAAFDAWNERFQPGLWRTAMTDAGIDVVGSEYATIAAENTALENLSRDVADRMVTAIALQLRASQ